MCFFKMDIALLYSFFSFLNIEVNSIQNSALFNNQSREVLKKDCEVVYCLHNVLNFLTFVITCKLLLGF